jgi:hypothetical protein
MPEITGERQEVEHEPVETVPEQSRQETGISNQTYRDLTGIGSPTRLRLNDFSGQGERAPPE